MDYNGISNEINCSRMVSSIDQTSEDIWQEFDKLSLSKIEQIKKSKQKKLRIKTLPLGSHKVSILPTKEP